MRGLRNPGTFDELDHLDLLRRQDEAEQNREAPLVRINPPEARNGILGGQQDVTGGGPLIQVVNFQSDDVNSLPMVISAAPVAGGAITGSLAFPFRPFLRVQWGTRGALMPPVDVDIGFGCQFTVGGSSCVVSVGADDALPIGNPTQPVVAMLSFWTTARKTPVYRTRYLDIFGGGVPVNVTRPNMAQDLTFERIALAGAMPAVLLDFLDSSGTVRYSATLAAGVLQTAPIPLSNDITSVTVTTAAVAVNARCIFGLCL